MTTPLGYLGIFLLNPASIPANTCDDRYPPRQKITVFYPADPLRSCLSTRVHHTRLTHLFTPRLDVFKWPHGGVL